MEKYQTEGNVNIQELFSKITEEGVADNENNSPFVNEECGDTLWDAVLAQTVEIKDLDPKTK